ncbi:hypothetical protein VQ02_05095 [Methylobacterium variabile]|uniref:Uncharacterized protein n=1 Tax=Methylobacterium variabile TaxID=298794 RepID=A0A0J6T2D6_9HYPH|nr:hypothetical protein VQ02_05095 [Methylobacterium variabile]
MLVLMIGNIIADDVGQKLHRCATYFGEIGIFSTDHIPCRSAIVDVKEILGQLILHLCRAENAIGS